MAFIEPETLDRMRIERMVFHVVGPDEADFLLLDEVEAGDHELFFCERLRATMKGSRFHFREGSATLRSLQTIAEDRRTFLEESRRLAQRFQAGHGGNTVRGVFLLFDLRIDNEQLFAFVKYDHETVLHYSIDGQHAILEEIRNTFVQSPEAMQKSALVRLTESGGDLCVIDRGKKDPARYFKVFLDAEREFEESELTRRIVDVAKTVGRTHKDELPDHVKRHLVSRIFDAVSQLDGFDAQDHEAFLSAIYGPLAEDSKLRKAFERKLRTERIDGETFSFVPDAVPRPRRKHFRTQEGVDVIFDSNLEGRIRIDEEQGEKVIKIRTSGLIVEGDYYDETGRR